MISQLLFLIYFFPKLALLITAFIEYPTVKELLGHKTLTMNLRYAHLDPGHKVKAVDILDNTINIPKTEEAQRVSTIQKLYNPTFATKKEVAGIS